MELEYTKHFNTNYQSLDYTNKWRLSTILNHFSDIATEHALKLGMWNPETIDQYGWVLSKLHLELNQQMNSEPFDMKTTVGIPSKVIFPRYFQILVNDQIVANGSSIWTLLDLQKRRIVMPKRIGLNIPLNEGFEPYCRLPETIDDVDYQFIETRKVRYSDIDTNKHMNNTRYIDWACDLIGLEFFEEHYFTSLDIYFKKEIAPNQNVDLYMLQQDQFIYIKGVVDEDDCFTIKFEYTTK